MKRRAFLGLGGTTLAAISARALAAGVEIPSRESSEANLAELALRPDGWVRLPPRFDGDIAFRKEYPHAVMAYITKAPPDARWHYGAFREHRDTGAVALEPAESFACAVAECEAMAEAAVEKWTPASLLIPCRKCGADSWREMPWAAGVECKACGWTIGYAEMARARAHVAKGQAT